MKTMISTGFRLTALVSLGFWWLWMLGGAAYYYTVEQATVWSSITSGTGIAIVACVASAFSFLISETFDSSS